MRRQPPLEPRYKGLLWLSGLCVLIGAAYLPLSNVPPRLPVGLDLLTTVVPIWVFGAMWSVVGVAAAITIFARRRGPWVFAAMVAMFTLWAASYTAALFFGDSRSWVAAGIFATAAGVTYQFTRVEPPLWVRRLLRGTRWTRT